MLRTDSTKLDLRRGGSGFYADTPSEDLPRNSSITDKPPLSVTETGAFEGQNSIGVECRKLFEERSSFTL
ncbi:hypothetical protein [Paenarthrobacter ureafaciens]|uniref:hypothetical protein n=1 Tax=Paenarthrobacter ureafaciens TaxID=37931 RepID=UPI001FB24A16|nr:hypothetical protein [Paenarthrobacter ureafaciens]UOD83507.1 hypothetical protein MQZ73_20670 [Paenarthrobacter ureafaciens]